MELKATSFVRSNDSKSLGDVAAPLQIGEAIDVARSRSGFTNTQLCAYMDNLDRGTWSKALDGEGHISLGRLLKCPPEFWRELLPIIADHYGLKVVEGGGGIGPSLSRCLLVMADVVARLELHAEQQARKVG